MPTAATAFTGPRPPSPGIATISRRSSPTTTAPHPPRTHGTARRRRATIRTGPGVFVRIDNLDRALATIAALRSRELHARADWVDRELPEHVDTYKNGGLLQMLDVDPATIPPVEVASQRG
jgi:hypothetical protein